VEKVTSRDGTTIAVDRSGVGPPMILVGGAFSQRRYPDLVRLAELLGRNFTVINLFREFVRRAFEGHRNSVRKTLRPFCT
jgi:hypothetical protein